MSLEVIQNLNRDKLIKDIKDNSFKTYGKVLEKYNFDELIKCALKEVDIPKEGNVYFGSEELFERYTVVDEIKEEIFGDIDIQVGRCTGHNYSLTGFEYHQGSEVIVAVTDCILILGKLWDLESNEFDTKKVQYFYLKAGEAVELYGTTLHYTPVKVEEEGFIALIMLIKGTNTNLEKRGNSILTKKNKFFVCHESQEEKIRQGAFIGLKGELIKVKYKS